MSTKYETLKERFFRFLEGYSKSEIDELVKDENLKEDSRRFIEKSINKGFVDYAGSELDSILPPTSRRKGAREVKKQSVLEKIRKMVEIFIGI